MKINLAIFLLTIIFFVCCQSNPYVQGERIYIAYCASCHMEDGVGLKGIYPPLANSDYLKEHHDELTCIITMGLSGPIQVNGKAYDFLMSPVNGLSPIQITNIINYISHAWGNDAGYTKIQDVEKAMANCRQ